MENNIIDLYLSDENIDSYFRIEKLREIAKSSKEIYLNKWTKELSLYDLLTFNNNEQIIYKLKTALSFFTSNYNDVYNYIFIFCLYYLNRIGIKCIQINFLDIPIILENIDNYAIEWNWRIGDEYLLKDYTYEKRDKFINNLTFNEFNFQNQKELITIDELTNINLNLLTDDDKRRIVERISDTIENILHDSELNKFKSVDEKLFFNIFNDEKIKKWRDKSQITRHKKEISFKEWNSLEEHEKDFLILSGFSILLILLNKK